MENLENTPPAHDITLGGQKEKGLNDSRVYSSAVAQLALGGDPPQSCSSFPELRSRGLLMVSGVVCLQTQGFLEGWLGGDVLGPLQLCPKGNAAQKEGIWGQSWF